MGLELLGSDGIPDRPDPRSGHAARLADAADCGPERGASGAASLVRVLLDVALDDRDSRVKGRRLVDIEARFTGEDTGTEKRITIQQKDLIRLTAGSRAVVAQGVQVLFERGVMQVEGLDRRRPYFSGGVLVFRVHRLKEEALSGVGREIKRLVDERS